MTLDADIDVLLAGLAKVDPIQLDPHLRLAVFNGQLGPMARHLTHDQQLHPYALPIQGSEQEQAKDFLIQALLFMRSRHLSIDLALEEGKARMRDLVFAKPTADKVERLTIYPGEGEGQLRVWRPDALFVSTGRYIVAFRNPYDCSDRLLQLMNRALVVGVILGSGGQTTHAAVLLREMKVPSYVTTNPEEWDMFTYLDGRVVQINGDHRAVR